MYRVKSYNKLLLPPFRTCEFYCHIKRESQYVTELKSVRNFVLELQTQPLKCGYGPQMDDELPDRLIARINMHEGQRRLLLLQDQTFPECTWSLRALP